MTETHDPNQLIGASQDIAPLAWVIDEIRTAFGHALTAMRAFLGNKQDLDSLRAARNQIHQSNGALQLLDLRGVALVTESVEQLLGRWEAEPAECLPSSVRSVESALAAVRAYLESLLSGRPNQPIRLFAYYREVLQLTQAARVHPADLIFPDLTRRPAFHNIEARQFSGDQLRMRRVLYEEGLLGFLRDADDARARRQMRDALYELEHLPQRGLARSFWWVIRGLLDALDSHRLVVDVDLKRLLARLNLQLRRLVEGGQVVAERLMVDALYYVGRADDKVARVAEIKRLYGLEALIPSDFERATLTAVDPDALRALREALAQGKTLWGQLVTSVSPDPARFRHEIDQARVAATRVEAHPLADVLAQIAQVTEGFGQLPPPVREGLGLEVASALLFVETGADDLPQLDPQSGERAMKVIERLRNAAQGQELPEAGPWLSDLARRAQDRLSMGTVVSETQATLREIEQRLDRFFRNPALREELVGIGPLIDQVCGVMSILGHEEPVTALRHVKQSVAHFEDGTAPTTQDEFSRIAQNLGAIGFFVETLAQDGAPPRGMFRYDPASGVFSADLAQFQATRSPDAADDYAPAFAMPEHATTPAAPDNVEAASHHRLAKAHTLAERLAVSPHDRAIQGQVADLLGQLSHDADLLDDSTLAGLVADGTRLLGTLQQGGGRTAAVELLARLTPSRPAMPEITAPMPASQVAADRELHDIFVGEGSEVLDSIVEHLVELRGQPADVGLLTTVRRGFHTLKGSGRMVGLKNFADGAWAVEQCFNVWLAQEKPATPDLIALAQGSADQMRDWLRAVASDRDALIDAETMIRNARTVREGGSFLAIQALPGVAERSHRPKDDGGAEAEESPALPSPTCVGAKEDADAFADAAIAGAGRETEQLAADDWAQISGLHHDAGSIVVVEDFAEPVSAPPAPGQASVDARSANDESADAPMREDTRRIGHIEISHGLYSVFLNEADESIRDLAQDIGEWRYEPERAVSTAAARRAHSLAGITATVGLDPVTAIADPLENLMHELASSRANAPSLTPPQFDVVERGIEKMRGMLHEFAAGNFPDEAPLEAGAMHDLLSVIRAQIEHRHDQTMLSAPAPLDLAPAPIEHDPAASSPDSMPEQVTPGLPQPALDLPEPASDLPQPALDLAEPASDLPQPTLDLPESASDLPQPTLNLPEPASDLADEMLALPESALELPEAVLEPAPEPASVVEPRTPESAREPWSPPPAMEVVEQVAPGGPSLAEQADTSAEAAYALEAGTSVAAESAIRDELDADLLPVFVTEAHDLLPAIGVSLRSLAVNPNERELARELMRHLHTIKGSARMAGAMRLGELIHEMETRIEAAMQLVTVPGVVIEDLQSQFDRALSLFDALQPGAPEDTGPTSEPAAPAPEAAAGEAGHSSAPASAPAPGRPQIGPAQYASAEPAVKGERAAAAATAAVSSPFIRVRADVLDKLVDHAGEVSIARSKLETEVGTLRGSLTDLTENIQRLRSQLREVEIQADAQIQARSDQLARESASFDPLEFDRFSRLQELTRMLAESVEDVAMVQNTMLKGLQLADNDLTAQSRLTRELQQQLMRVRLVPFANVSERLYRVARQTAKEVDKRVHLEIVGGGTEIDRGVLERMSGPFEHLVRNAIVHGIESPERRRALGKAESGELRIDVKQEGNEIIVVFADDGAGLNLERIRERGIELQLIDPGRKASERELSELIFAPGFSTASEVTELAGRGIGMDVVRSELASFGGRVAVTTEAGRGTRFAAYLPLTLAVTQVVLASVGGRRYAIPAAMVQQVRRYRAYEVEAALREGSLEFGGDGMVVVRSMAQLLGIEVPLGLSRQTPVALLRSGEDRLAIVVDELTSNQEVVVKNVGPQVARLTGVLGATILGSGEIVLIFNPVQLIAHAPEPAPVPESGATVDEDGDAEIIGATIMVVDDSLTVRRVTQRLLERQGFQVMLAKDGVDALRQMQEALPDVLLVDIEMPRMDGYDFTRAVRSAPATANIPILMITSRTAGKHRSLALELGVNEYLGKPYQEDELLRLIRQYLAARASA